MHCRRLGVRGGFASRQRQCQRSRQPKDRLPCVFTTSRSMASMSGTAQKEGEEQQHQQQVEVSLRKPAKSLSSHARTKGYLSVTDLVSPLWCEYAFHYGILGMRHLPVAQRPEEIETADGHVIRPDTKVAQQREKVLVGGRKVHERLEKEIHPIKIHVQTATREDAWGLRILRLVTGIKNLIDTGCCRELPVFGFVHGKLVMGIIDEINRRPLTKRLNTYLDRGEEKDKTTTLQQFFTSSRDQNDDGRQQEGGKNALAGAKRWASQEDWKKEKRKSTSLAKVTKKSTKEEQPRLKDPEAGQASLASFFGNGKSVKQLPDTNATQSRPSERFGYFLEDSKTRVGRLLPPAEDQVQARLQCMLYKRLFDGILSGNVQQGSVRQDKAKETEVLAVDEYATPVDPATLFAFLDLDASAPLSDEFLHGAEELVSGYGVTLQPDPNASQHTMVCTLNTLVSLLQETLAELTFSARNGLGWNDSEAISGALQHHLRLTYRKRKGGFKKRRGFGDVERRVQPSRLAKKTNGDDAPMEQGQRPKSVGDPVQPSNTHGEDMQIAITLQLGFDAALDEATIEDEILRDNGIVVPTSSPSKARSSHEQTDGEEGDDAVIKTGKDVLGTVDFYHNAIRLEGHIQDMMKLWGGERAMRGVTLEQSWRCYQCEFRHDCEWREAKGQERLDDVTRKRLAREAKQLDRDNSVSGSDNEEGSHSPCRKVERKSTTNTAPAHGPRADLDEEETLWSQFEDIIDEELRW